LLGAALVEQYARWHADRLCGLSVQPTQAHDGEVAPDRLVGLDDEHI
jgi:hypothetical protein